MPRVKQVRAAKDYPRHGIKKGDLHYHWKIKQQRGGIEFRSLTPPKRSQLTTSAFLGPLYDIQDSIDAITHDASAVDALRSIAEEVTTLGEEQREKYENLGENFQQGSTGELLDERANGCDDWVSEIERAADDLEQKIEEINAMEPHELDNLEAPDPEDEDDDTPMPTEEEITEAREAMITEAAGDAIDNAGSACPF